MNWNIKGKKKDEFKEGMERRRVIDQANQSIREMNQTR